MISSVPQLHQKELTHLAMRTCRANKQILEQLAPTGGRYGILATTAPNVLDRVKGVRERLAKSKWVEVSCLDSP